jgi:hypothetical protein
MVKGIIYRIMGDSGIIGNNWGQPLISPGEISGCPQLFSPIIPIISQLFLFP